MVYCGNTARVTISVHNLARIFLRNKLQARIINDSFKHPARVFLENMNFCILLRLSWIEIYGLNNQEHHLLNV